jgi:hypothetical protein
MIETKDRSAVYRDRIPAGEWRPFYRTLVKATPAMAGVILIEPTPNHLRIEPRDGHNDHDRGDWADGVRIPYFKEALELDAQW